MIIMNFCLLVVATFLSLTGSAVCVFLCSINSSVGCVNCRATCQNPTVSESCNHTLCEPGCNCNPGFTWDDNSRQCVSSCPPANTTGITVDNSTLTCPANSTPVECVCQSSCQNPSKICTMICTKGCACNQGHTWDEEAENCVESCPETEAQMMKKMHKHMREMIKKMRVMEKEMKKMEEMEIMESSGTDSIP